MLQYIDDADRLYEEGKELFLNGDYKKSKHLMMEVEELAGGPYRNSTHYLTEARKAEEELAPKKPKKQETAVTTTHCSCRLSNGTRDFRKPVSLGVQHQLTPLVTVASRSVIFSKQ